MTSSFGDSVVMDDRASMIEALHERVLAVLGETPDDEIALLAQAANEDVPSASDVVLGRKTAWREALAPVGVSREPDVLYDKHGQPRLL